VRHAGEVKDNLFPLPTHEPVDGPFQLLAFPADLDSSRYFQDNNVKAQVRGLNLQHKPSSFPIFELLLNGIR
jgi:hypothetical protein